MVVLVGEHVLLLEDGPEAVTLVVAAAELERLDVVVPVGARVVEKEALDEALEESVEVCDGLPVLEAV